MNKTGISTVCVISTGLKLEITKCSLQEHKYYVYSLMFDTEHEPRIQIKNDSKR